jgi:hypothetical protein
MCRFSTQWTRKISNGTQTWHPNFEVNTTEDEEATIIVVSNMGIGYPQKRNDPIFPAETTFDNKWYYNTRGHGGVLGCIDRTYICLQDEQCAPIRTWEAVLGSYDERAQPLIYLYLSALRSNAGASLDYRRAEGLDAASKLAGEGDLSLALDTEQWKVEVTQLFQTSLARIQIEARNIARGNPNTPTSYSINLMETLPNLLELCNMYKFKTIGWRNISVSGFLGAIIAGLMVLFLGRTTGSEENEDELRIEEYCKTLSESFTEFRGGLRDGFKTSLSYITKSIKKGVGECDDMLRRLREIKLPRAAARDRQPCRSNGTDPRISDGIEM